ncbi:MAG: alpha/beta hydrolase [Myxococcota bacterium]|nr:alpha/beta hydrolase [Myxococcota bacterium]
MSGGAEVFAGAGITSQAAERGGQNGRESSAGVPANPGEGSLNVAGDGMSSRVQTGDQSDTDTIAGRALAAGQVDESANDQADDHEDLMGAGRVGEQVGDEASTGGGGVVYLGLGAGAIGAGGDDILDEQVAGSMSVERGGDAVDAADENQGGHDGNGGPATSGVPMLGGHAAFGGHTNVGGAQRGGRPASGGDDTITGGFDAWDDLPLCTTGFGGLPVQRNVPYAETDERQRLDLYLTDAPGPNPLLIWIHGGGWRQGSKNNPPLLWFRQRGYSIAAIEYRFSNSGYPAPMLDVKAAVRWLRANAAQYALDPQRFAAVGSSAGGHLAAMVGATAKVEVFDDVRLGHADVSSAVQAVVNLYGPIDLSNMRQDRLMAECPVPEDCPGCPLTSVTQLLGCTVEDCPQKAIQASPITYVHPEMPPHLTLHGLADCSVAPNQSQRLHDALLAQGVQSNLRMVNGAGHARDEVLTDETLGQLTEFLERTLRACRPESLEMNVPGSEQVRPLNACLYEACSANAERCAGDEQCVELEQCFQSCLSEGRLDCPAACLTEIGLDFNAPIVQNVHRPLYDCGQGQGCYPSRQLEDCLHNGCADLARTCEQDTDCVRLELCFQDCFNNGGRQQACIARCLGQTGIEMDDIVVTDVHRPLYQCGRPLGCYDQAFVMPGMGDGCNVQWEQGAVMRNMAYADEDPRQILDLYLTTAPGPNPLIIWIHGGGWRGGSHRAVPQPILDLRSRGYTIASIEYRLSDAPWPATVVDVKAAVRWLRARAVNYGLDPNRFVATGASAGGHLASMLGTTIGVASFEQAELGNGDVSSAVQTVVNFYGPSALLFMDIDAAGCPAGSLIHDAADSPEGLLLDCQPSTCPARAEEASPLTYVDGNEPPFLIFHGSQDCTVPTPQGQRLHDALITAGQDSTLFIVNGAGHNLNQCLADGNYDTMVQFIDRQMGVCQ